MLCRAVTCSDLFMFFCQVSIDFDYFSQHSHGGGGLSPMWMMPMPTPSYPPPEAGADGADAAGAHFRRAYS